MKTTPISLIFAGLLVPLAGQDRPQFPPAEEKPDHRPDFRKAWERADTNGDGVISREEFEAIPRLRELPEEKRERLFSRLDKDGDGSLSREELERMMRGRDGRWRQMRRLWELDTDRSGGVSFEEFKQGELFRKLPPEKQEELFKRLDTDGDGEITPKDRPEPPPERPRPSEQQLIEHFDVDGDGKLSLEELRKVPFFREWVDDAEEAGGE